MTVLGEPSSELSNHESNFEMPNHGAIREDNWPEYEAQGFENMIGKLDSIQALYGAQYVFTGDEFDDDENRPLRHKPGIGIYVSGEGIRLYKERYAQWQKDHPSS